MTNKQDNQKKLDELNNKFPFRVEQTKHLYRLIGNDDLPSCPVIVAHGTEATGKTSVIKALLQTIDASFSWISCKECVTVRHLVERIATSFVGQTRKLLQQNGQDLPDMPAFQIRPDGIASLHEQLQACAMYLPKHILVLDNVDQHREMNSIILSGLARLGERIDGICVIIIVTVPRIRFINLSEPPYVFFPAYKKEECVNILAREPKSIFGSGGSEDSDSEEGYTDQMAKEDDQWLWAQCCSATWDTLGKYAARNVIELRDAVDEIWEPLIQPILQGEFGTRDFSKLFNVLKNEKLRNREESFVSNTIVHDTIENQKPVANRTYDLPWFSKFLVCSAYLASYTPKKNDMKLFMKGGEGSKKQRRGGSRKIAKNRQLNRNHLGPQAFTMERMMAIFHAILPFEITDSVDIGCQIATLSSLRLLMKAPASSVLDASAKWRINVGYDYVQNLARGIKFDIDDYLEE